MYIFNRMTKNLTTATPDLSLSKAYALMNSTKHSSLPVVDSDGKLIGLITTKMIANMNNSEVGGLSSYEINMLSSTKVKDIMQAGVSTINENAYLEDAALIMKENHIKALPVLNNENKLVGIITQSDIFKGLLDILNSKVSGSRIIIKQPASLSDLCRLLENNNINILNISTVSSEIILKTNSLETDKAVTILTSNGYNIISFSTQL